MVHSSRDTRAANVLQVITPTARQAGRRDPDIAVAFSGPRAIGLRVCDVSRSGPVSRVSVSLESYVRLGMAFGQ